MQETPKTYDISFGTAFAVDQFGFVRRGKLTITDAAVRLEGFKHWSALARLGVFLAITILPLLLFGFALGILLALVVIHYACASQASLQWPKVQVRNVFRSGNQVSFVAPMSTSGKLRKALFRALDEAVAAQIEELIARPPSQSADARPATSAGEWPGVSPPAVHTPEPVLRPKQSYTLSQTTRLIVWATLALEILLALFPPMRITWILERTGMVAGRTAHFFLLSRRHGAWTIDSGRFLVYAVLIALAGTGAILLARWLQSSSTAQLRKPPAA